MDNLTILEEEFKQRAYDGKWQRWIKVPDLENTYSFVNENRNRTTLIPTMWLVTDVYDYLMEIVD